ncbi:lipopolysaccharide biosynthesis protein [Aliarcobacter butzleri]|uniref:lipopolysaccharide biosynthesis protein n=1 Tax=Aliarcobacter butzleri TaxID=28197 RepID=UPI001EDC1569|nr:oligosaccharide flippase family protein [Aliarcobacter butzleri]MCG3683477.1 oligosaccharide flippase family protein [Aliarcobacter butzleri]
MLNHFIKYLFGDILVKALGLISLPIYTYFIAPEEYGIYALVLSYISIGVLILTLNVHASVSRFYYDKKLNINTFMSTTVWLSLIVLGISIFIIYLFDTNYLSSILSIEFDKFGTLIIFLIFFNILFGIYTQTLIPQRKSYEYSKINVIKTYSIFFVALSFLYFWQSNAKSMIYAMTFVEFFIFIYVLKQLLPNIKLTMTKESMSYIFNYSVFLLPYSLAGIVMAQIDRVMLAKYMTTYEVGIYSVAYTLSMIPFMLFMTISKAWTPEYFKYMDEKDYNKLDRDVGYILWVVTFLLFSMILFSKEIVFILLDVRYFQAEQVLPLVTFSVLFIVLWQMWGRGIGYIRKTIWSSIIGILSAIVNIGLNYYLIPLHGIDGAVYATLFSYIFMAFFGYIISKYYLKIYTVSIEKLKYIFGFNVLVLCLIFIENIYILSSLKILYFIGLVYLVVKYKDMINEKLIAKLRGKK